MPPTNATAKLRRALILCLVSGPWQVRGKVVHHCMECCTSREDCVDKFGAFFVGAVAGTNLPMWPLARWLGQRRFSVGSVATHSLLEIVFCSWDSVRVGGRALERCSCWHADANRQGVKTYAYDGWARRFNSQCRIQRRGEKCTR